MENTPNTHAAPEHAEPRAAHNTFLAIIAYIGPLVVLSYILGRDDEFVKFHIKQGLAILIIEIAAWLIITIVPWIWMLWRLVRLVTLVLSIIGIVNVAQNKEKELPVIGAWAKNLKI